MQLHIVKNYFKIIDKIFCGLRYYAYLCISQLVGRIPESKFEGRSNPNLHQIEIFVYYVYYAIPKIF